MLLKGIIAEDFLQYKKPCMVLEFPHCSFKCDVECGESVCQNGELALKPNIEFKIETICKIFINNDISKAICCQGLEPFDSWDNLYTLIKTIRFIYHIENEIIIYTGYSKNEIKNKVKLLSSIPNIIIKFGRYIPNSNKVFDKILGIYLASDNQYAERIS